MQHHNHHIGKQRGTSLIGLMVGVVLAMIGILAGVNLYENAIRTSVQTRSDAALEGQIASSMLTLQLELQSAGFGIVKDPAVSHLAQTADSIYWRYVEPVPNTPHCKGFRILSSADGLRRELQLLKLKAGCNITAVLTTFNWSDAGVETTTLAEFHKSTAAASELPAINVAPITSQSCFPYGMGTKAVHPVVTITADNVAITEAKRLDAAAVGPTAPYRYDICLPNL